jgi:hypothetical protein
MGDMIGAGPSPVSEMTPGGHGHLGIPSGISGAVSRQSKRKKKRMSRNSNKELDKLALQAFQETLMQGDNSQ